MPRPKIYANKDEVREAKAAARRRHYERNRDEINANRRDEYHRRKRSEAKKKAKKAKTGPNQASMNAQVREKAVDKRGKAERERDHRIETALARARTLPKELSNIMAGSSKAFFDHVCKNHFSDLALYGRNATLEILRLYCGRFEALAKKLEPWQRTVWAETGCSKEWKDIEVIQKDIQQHVMWMSEIEVYADLLPDELASEYEGEGLGFQRDLKV